jgi:cell wall-associated NlpC family hydrolase
MTGEQLAIAAEALVGSPFRLHGRHPATGLDCIGVLAVALTATGNPGKLPNGYSLRNRALPDTDGAATNCGFVHVTGECVAGDIVLCRVSPCQFHLAIALGPDRFVHAHAGLRRVVLSPGPRPWPILQHWRPMSAA